VNIIVSVNFCKNVPCLADLLLSRKSCTLKI
jgi:hypothetical protein